MNQSIGKFFSYFLPIIVILVMYIVISRYVFGVGRADLQELALYLHALVFLGCTGWALAEEEHVRVDILYKEKSQKLKSNKDVKENKKPFFRKQFYAIATFFVINNNLR